MVALYKQHEAELVAADQEIEKIEHEGRELFERKIIAIKNALVEDVNVPDDDLQKVFKEKLEIARQEVLADAEQRIEMLLKKHGVEE